MYWVKIIEIKKKNTILDVILGIVDEELLDKKIKYNNIIIHINPRFYKGKLVDEDFIKNIINKVTIINAFGKNSIELLKKMNLIKEEDVKYFNNIPHVQIIFLKNK